MKDFRCEYCNRLLARIEGGDKVEIKCPRCKNINTYSEEIFITIEEKAGDVCTDQDTVAS
jgi:phage FluMu protein Com